MPAPKSSHQILGKVYDADVNLLEGATVLLTHVSSEETLPTTTNSSGEYILNLKNLTSWAVGDSITLKASKTKYGQKTETLIVTSSPGDTKDITLEYTSDYGISPIEYKKLLANATILFDFEGNLITPENPLPVNNTDFDLINNPSTSWVLTRADRQPDSETITIKGVSYKRTFTYNDDGGLIARSNWVKQ